MAAPPAPPALLTASLAAATIVPLLGAAVAAVALAKTQTRKRQWHVLGLDEARTPYGKTPRMQDQWRVWQECKEGFPREFRKYSLGRLGSTTSTLREAREGQNLPGEARRRAKKQGSGSINLDCENGSLTPSSRQ